MLLPPFGINCSLPYFLFGQFQNTPLKHNKTFGNLQQNDNETTSYHANRFKMQLE